MPISDAELAEVRRRPGYRPALWSGRLGVLSYLVFGYVVLFRAGHRLNPGHLGSLMLGMALIWISFYQLRRAGSTPDRQDTRASVADRNVGAIFRRDVFWLRQR